MAAVKAPQEMRGAQFVELRIESYQFGVIEVEKTGDKKNAKSVSDCGRRIVGEAGAREENGLRAFAGLREARSHARAPGKPGEVHALVVNGETIVGVVPHRFRSLALRFPGTIFGIVGSRDDVAEFFGRGFCQRGWNFAARVGRKNIHDWPAFRRGIIGRKIKSISLFPRGAGGNFG